MDLLIFAFITLYFIYKLNKALGNKDYGYDHFKSNNTQDSSNNDQSSEKVISAKVEISDDEVIISKDANIIKGLKQIRDYDKTFNELAFIKSASTAFEMILNAFSNSDKNTLQMLLSKKIYEEFCFYIDDREKNHFTIEQSLISIKNVNITDTTISDMKAYITVQYISDQIYVKKDINHNVIEGDASKVIRKIDKWTFMKNFLNNEQIWELISTE